MMTFGSHFKTVVSNGSKALSVHLKLQSCWCVPYRHGVFAMAMLNVWQFLIWEINCIFTQILFIVLLLQYDHSKYTHNVTLMLLCKKCFLQFCFQICYLSGGGIKSVLAFMTGSTVMLKEINIRFLPDSNSYTVRCLIQILVLIL